MAGANPPLQLQLLIQLLQLLELEFQLLFQLLQLHLRIQQLLLLELQLLLQRQLLQLHLLQLQLQVLLRLLQLLQLLLQLLLLLQLEPRSERLATERRIASQHNNRRRGGRWAACYLNGGPGRIQTTKT